MIDNGPQRADSSLSSPRVARSRVWAMCVVVGLLVAGGVATAWWWRPRTQPPAAPVADVDIEDPAVPDPGYVGPQACAPCHARRVAEFQATHHFRACRVPKTGDMPSGFAPGHGTYATRAPAVRFEMTQSGDDFFETATYATSAGEQRTTSRIGLVYGAGAADEVFHTWHDDGLFQLPVVWLHPQNRWGNISYNRYGTGDFARPTTTRCLECHNTWFEHVAGTPNEYKRDHAVLGVTCERCHGPGREHVAYHQAHPEETTGQRVLHPGHLARDLQLAVCAQCHGNVTKPLGPAFSYRPGQPLETSYRTARTKHPEDDHVANQVKYLRQSKCFQNNKTLTCITCHNPHRPHGPAESDSVRQACLKCHQPADCGEQTRLPAAVRGDCVSCHMPQRVWMNVHFHTEDDQYVPPATRHEHRIAIDPVARQEVLLAWYRTQSDAASREEADRLTKLLVEHWLSEATDRRREYRFLAAIGSLREVLRLDSSPAMRARFREAVALQSGLESDLVEAQHQMDEKLYPEAVETLTKILSVKPDLATAHGKLGTAYASLGKEERAVEQWQLAASADPDDPYGYAMLGWLAYGNKQPAEALEFYRRADQIEPYNAKIHYFMGLALVGLEQWTEAGDAFRLVLTIDPRHVGGCEGLSRVLRQQGQFAEALRYARHAARLTEFENADILVTLAEAYADVDRFAEARDTVARALALAEKSASQRVPELRRRLEDYQARAKRAPK